MLTSLKRVSLLAHRVELDRVSTAEPATEERSDGNEALG